VFEKRIVREVFLLVPVQAIRANWRNIRFSVQKPSFCKETFMAVAQQGWQNKGFPPVHRNFAGNKKPDKHPFVLFNNRWVRPLLEHPPAEKGIQGPLEGQRYWKWD